MKAITSHYKNPKVFLTLTFLILLLALHLLTSYLQSKNQPPPPNSWNNILPGKSTAKHIEEILGEPVEAPGPRNPDSKNYASDNQYYPHEVVYSDDKAELIIQRSQNFPEGSAATYYQQYGNPQAILPTSETSIGLHLYVWLDIGIALHAHDESGKIFEIWYFRPMDINTFKAMFQTQIGSYDSSQF